MRSVFTVVGASGTGKTRVAVALVRSLVRRGYRVAAIKHAPHGHEMDRVGSDTDRLFDAGASAVMAASPGGASARYQQPAPDRPLEDIVAWWGPDCDVVIAEGFKQSRVPKVLVEGGDTGPTRISNIVARVDGHGASADEVPVFTFEQMDELADLLERMMSTSLPDGPAARLTVDGHNIWLNRFPSAALASVVTGFVSSLKGVPGPERSITVTVDLGRRDRNQASRPGRPAPRSP